MHHVNKHKRNDRTGVPRDIMSPLPPPAAVVESSPWHEFQTPETKTMEKKSQNNNT